MNKPIIIISKFYKRVYIASKTRSLLFYNSFDFFRLHVNVYASLNDETKIFNHFNLKFAFTDI